MTPQERVEFIADITAAIHIAQPVLSEDEQRWVRMAIQKQAQSTALRQAVIEKTLAGIVWALVVGLFYLVVDFLVAHGAKL